MNSERSLKATIINYARIELARRVFWDFCLYMDKDFFSKRTFLKQVADIFQKVHDGELKKVSISMPPRAGKSYITSLFAAWTLAKKPSESVMRNTCTATLYEKFSYDTRGIVSSDKFKEVFPQIQLAADKQNLRGWNICAVDENDTKIAESKQVGYFGAGVEGTIIGFGASAVAITDDLYTDISEALSETKNAKIKQWKRATHDSRLEKNCPEIDIGTRWSKQDIIGENIESGKYQVSIKIEALQDDKSFCEHVKSTEEYIRIRDELIAANSIEIWLAEYQQEPAEVQGLLFVKSEIKRFTMKQFIEETTRKDIKSGKEFSGVECVLGYIDPAEGGGDALAYPIGQITKNHVYVTDVIYTTETVEQSVPRCAKLSAKLNVNYVRIEKNGLGSGFIRDMRRNFAPERILAVKNVKHKGTRIWNEYGFIQKYFYFLSETEYAPGSDYDKFMRNLFSYMKIGENQQDGAPDASAGLSRFVQANPNTKIFFDSFTDEPNTQSDT